MNKLTKVIQSLEADMVDSLKKAQEPMLRLRNPEVAAGYVSMAQTLRSVIKALKLLEE